MPSAAIWAVGPGGLAESGSGGEGGGAGAGGSGSSAGSGGVEVGSLEHVRSSEAFPLCEAERLGSTEDSDSSLLGAASDGGEDGGGGNGRKWPPFPLLPGEAVSRFGRGSRGLRLFLTNFRLMVLKPGLSFHDVPIAAVESVEVRELFLFLAVKDGRLIRLDYESSEDCLSWHKALAPLSGGLEKRERAFAFAYRAWCVDGGVAVGRVEPRSLYAHTIAKSATQAEFRRLGFDPKLWRVSNVNEGYKLCASYPEAWILPAGFADEQVQSGAEHRWLKRAPAVAWRHGLNGTLLLRSAQPSPGLFSWRNKADEALLAAFADAAAADSPSSTQAPLPLLIMDARSYAAAFANRAKGGGFENPEYYPKTQAIFMGLANIHAIRSSFAQLRALQAGAAEGGDDATYQQSLQSSQWLHHLSLLLKAAHTAADALHRSARSVLVHCSDGWDRTPQIVSLTKLLLDPHARTLHGFRALIERDWVEFGHKFEDRLGLLANGNPSERSPVFLQFLDAVHQLQRQFPLAFQFNEAYLAKLARHASSALFGTFLCNSPAEIVKEKVRERSFPVWALLADSAFTNLLYEARAGPLWPQTSVSSLLVWSRLYSPPDLDGPSRPRAALTAAAAAAQTPPRTQSCDSLNSEPPPPPVPNHVSNPTGQTPANTSSSNLSSALPRTGSDSSLSYPSLSSPNVEEMVSAATAQEDSTPPPESRNGTSTPIDRDEVDSTPKLVAEALAGLAPPSAESERRESFTEDPLFSDDARLGGPPEPCPPPTVSTSTSDISDSLVRRRPRPSPSATQKSSAASNGGIGKGAKRRHLSDFLDADGLATYLDEVQERVKSISAGYLRHINRLEAQMQRMRMENGGGGGGAEAGEIGGIWDVEEVVSDLEVEAEDPPGWEGLRDDATKWVPDHAVSHCMGCDAVFWTVNRKHHCRSCGKIFCSKCSSGMAEVPEEALFHPVRVCDTCFARLSAHNTPTTEEADSESPPAQASSPPSPASPRDKAISACA